MTENQWKSLLSPLAAEQIWSRGLHRSMCARFTQKDQSCHCANVRIHAKMTLFRKQKWYNDTIWYPLHYITLPRCLDSPFAPDSQNEIIRRWLSSSLVQLSSFAPPQSWFAPATTRFRRSKINLQRQVISHFLISPTTSYSIYHWNLIVRYVSGIFWDISDLHRSTRVWTLVLVVVRSGSTCFYVVQLLSQ